MNGVNLSVNKNTEYLRVSLEPKGLLDKWIMEGLHFDVGVAENTSRIDRKKHCPLENGKHLFWAIYEGFYIRMF